MHVAFSSALLAALVGCGAFTHEYAVRGYAAPPAGVAAAPKRIAVVFATANIRPKYETSTDGHTFVFRQLRQFYEQAFTTALRGGGHELEMISSGDEADGEFDAYLVPKVSLEASGWLNHHCTARFEVELRDREHRPIAREVTSASDSFIAIADAERACTAALRMSFQKAYPIFHELGGAR